MRALPTSLRDRFGPALALALLGLVACGSADQSYRVTGQVEAIDAAARQVKIAHDDIPGFMPAMTMNFGVASPQLLEDVEVGATVRFTLVRNATLLRITELEVLEAGSAGTGGSLGIEVAEEAFDFRLTDHEGETLALSDLRGQAVLVDFMFTRCLGPCPILTSSHAALQRSLPPEVSERSHFVSISVDPGYDTPERLREYALARGADLERWSFLTGSVTDVQEVLDRYYIGTARAKDGSFDHVVATYLIGPDGAIVSRYLGLEHRPEDILRDIESAL